MDLTDILSLEEWIEFEKDIHEKSGLDVSVFDTEGIRITSSKKWVNRLCPVIKANDKGQAFICAVAHMNIAAQAKNERKAVIEECDAGLIKLVVPILVNEEFVGSVGACGLLLGDGEVDSYMINRTTEIKEKEIESLLNEIARITTEDAQSIAAYIQEQLDRIIEGFHQKRV
ncbi:MAG: PocR ligand-binding domain-containing protein [Deltaproteobacteria bacterium]|nr:PocR ligand-binding domain-containing protein [Deltaproteobacteria bacterium]